MSQVLLERQFLPVAQSEHIALVRNGPGASRFRLVEPGPALLKPGQTVIVYVGISGPQDGVAYLLRSL